MTLPAPPAAPASAAGRTVLLRHADVVLTMDDTPGAGGAEIRGGGLLIEGNRIVAVAADDALPATADEVIDLSGHILLPGLINTHHHMYQSLTRALPAAQDAELFDWLTALYPIWARLTPEMLHVSTQTAMAELLLSGCTTSSDHLYIFPNGCRLDHCLEAAAAVGMRFHASRGAMSLGRSRGGLPPDAVVEDEDAILRDTARLIEAYHQPGFGAMRRVVVAPCSPFTVTPALMREAAALARAYKVSLHTHLAENARDVAFSRERFGQTPAEFVEDLGWVGADVWHAHCVHLDAPGIALFARTGTGVAHCPCSNMRLASGIAPVRHLLAAGGKVGLGVDGSASNDGGHMLGEARQALLLARVLGGPDALSARQALRMATRGGAAVLNRDDIGALAPGMAADCVAFRLDAPGLAGGLHDPVAALVFCQPGPVALSIIDGRVVVRDGQIATIDLPVLVERHNRLARLLAEPP